MTQPGYPDYERVSFAAGNLFAGAQQAFTATTEIFRGFVGSWPYINFFWDAVGGAAHQTIQVLYYADPGFTQLVAQQISVRNSNIVAYRQYAVLSPWIRIVVIPDIGTDNTQCLYAFYGTTQKCTSAKLGSLDNIFCELNSSVGAGATVSDTLVKIFPGAATLSVFSGVATSEFVINRWDQGSSSFVPIFDILGLTSNFNQTTSVSLPDTPIQVQMINHTAGAGQMKMFMMPTMD